jgi:hypothetical protein
MRYLVALCLAIGFSANSYAGVCEYSPPKVEAITYQSGKYLPVYFSTLQIDLPERPIGFVGGEGFIAVYPHSGYVGVQHLDAAMMGDSLLRLAKKLTSVADYYRLIYGAAHSADGIVDAQELTLQRDLAKLDCNADVAFFRLNDVEVIFHGARESGDFHKVLVLDGEAVNLITVRGDRQTALRILSSIKRR